MPSYYDPAKKCRTGIMDAAQLRVEATAKNAAFFAALIESWTESGGSLRWGAGGVSLRGTLAGHEVALWCWARR